LWSRDVEHVTKSHVTCCAQQHVTTSLMKLAVGE